MAAYVAQRWQFKNGLKAVVKTPAGTCMRGKLINVSLDGDPSWFLQGGLFQGEPLSTLIMPDDVVYISSDTTLCLRRCKDKNPKCPGCFGGYL